MNEKKPQGSLWTTPASTEPIPELHNLKLVNITPEEWERIKAQIDARLRKGGWLRRRTPPWLYD